MKRFIILLAIAAMMAGQNARHTEPDSLESLGYIHREAVATAADVLTLDDGEQIQLHNGDRLSIGETYILLLDPVNDGELLDYSDMETYELDNNLLS